MFRGAGYRFNRETFAIERHIVTSRKRKMKSALLVVLSFAAFAAYYFIYTDLMGLDTPKTAMLKQKSDELRSGLELLERRMDANNTLLLELQRRDNNVYRSVYGMEEIPVDVRNAGFGGVDRYRHFEMLSNGEFLAGLAQKMDVLYKKAYVQSCSYEDVVVLARKNGEMVSCVPAIPPVQLDNIHLSSRFGYRSDPFKGTPKMHNGLDFAGSKGEPVYATGNGKVIEAARNFFGYGNEVVIDHGFGYKTRYAHLDKILVKEGQMVERGELVGELGNSGRSTGPHLHYEVSYRDRMVNPMNFFNSDLRGTDFEAMLKKENAQLSTRYQSLYVTPLRDREVADRYRCYSRCCDGWDIFKVDREYIMRNLRSRYSTNYDPQVIFGALDKAYRSIVDQLG